MEARLSRPHPLLAVCLALAACDSSAPPLATTAAPAPLAKPASTDELKGLAKSSNAFGLDFYGKVRSRKGNLVMSPFSLSTALAMTWAGARGETAAQMAKVLHLDGPVDRTLDLCGSLVASYGAPDQGVTVHIANRLFGEKTYAFEQPYLARLKSAFGAPIEPIDFKRGAEDGRKRINAWIEGETHGRINDLIPTSGVSERTRLALVNAIYFLGDWAAPFNKDHTAPAPFFTSKSEKKDVPTMHQQEHFHFAATDGVEVLEMPYQNGALAMDLVLPDAVDGLDAVEARLTPAVFEQWMGAASSATVSVSLPRVEIAPAEPLALADTLSALGMPLAFDAGKADFTGIGNAPNPEERLFLSKVVHKAFLKIDEKGTEAAAATAALPVAAGISRVALVPKEFRADHPFLFFLRDVRSGLVLFMGRVADPAGK